MSFELSEYQKRIKMYFMSHPHNNMAVEALAGTGKSSTILVLTELSKTSDVYVAFNKSIQSEMKSKITNPKTKCFTMHGLGLSVMNYNLDKMGKKCTLDNYKVHRYVDLLCKKYEPKTLGNAKRKDWLTTNYSTTYNLLRLKCLDITTDNVKYLFNEMGLFQPEEDCGLPHSIEEITSWVAEIHNLSQEDFTERQICDFTDMLYITYNQLRDKKWEVPYWMLYTNIYFDEAQDASRLQLSLLKFFKRGGGRYVFVYDSHQAIYGFAGGDCRSYQNIFKMFAPLEKFELPINYRCGSTILDYTNELFHVGIQPRPNANEGRIIHILEEDINKYIKPNDFLIGRINQQLIAIGFDLVKQGKKIYLEEKEIVTKLLKFIKAQKSLNVDTLLESCQQGLEAPPPEGQPVNLEEKANFGVVRDLLINYRVEHESKAINSFINYINEVLNTEDPSGCIRIMSIHKSKGLEAENVFILNEAKPFEKLGRSKDMIQQEKNLSYVAITRAKENLYLVKRVESSENEDF